MTDLHQALQQRADRGHPLGATAVLEAARGQGGTSVPGAPDRHRRLAAVLAVAVVLLLVAVAVVIANRDDPADQAPVDEGQVETTPTPEIIDGPLFGAETGATLVVSGDPGPRAVAIDLDGGTVRALDGVTPVFDSNTAWDEIGVVRDRLVFTNGQGLWTASTDLAGSPAAQAGPLLGRDVGWNDVLTYFPSGDTDRFWVTGGPIADRPEREFLAEERNLTGEVVTPPISLGRSDEWVVGATSELVIVSVPSGGLSRVELRDRVTQEVVRTLPGFVDAVDERVVWTECQMGCPLHVLDLDTGDERQIDAGPTVDIGAAVLSPDGSRLAVMGGGEDPRLGSIDLATGDLWLSESPGDISLALDPVWSPDGQWLFAVSGSSPGADPRNLVGYRVGEAQGTEVSIAGLRIWSLVAIPRVPGPESNSVPACEPTMDGPCRPIVTSGPPPATPPADDIILVDPATTATTLPAGAIDRRDVPVMVANGTEVEGAAGSVTELLIGLGYDPGAPDGTSQPVAEQTPDTVYFVGGFEAAAQQVAVDLGLPSSSVTPMPVEPPLDIGLAGVVVLLGSAPGGLATSVSTSTTVPPWSPFWVLPCVLHNTGEYPEALVSVVRLRSRSEAGHR